MANNFDDATRILDKAEGESNIINAVDFYFEGLEMLLEVLQADNMGGNSKRYENKFRTYANQLQKRCFGILNKEEALNKEEISSLWEVYEFFDNNNFFQDEDVKKEFLLKLHVFDSRLDFWDGFKSEISNKIQSELKEIYKQPETVINKNKEEPFLGIYSNLSRDVEMSRKGKDFIDKQIRFVLTYGKNRGLQSFLENKFIELQLRNSKRVDDLENPKLENISKKCGTLSLSGKTLSLKGGSSED